MEHKQQDAAQEQQERLRRAFTITEPPREEPASDDWREQLQGVQPLQGTPGESYLVGRGIPLDVANAAGVRFAPKWYGRAAVVYPLRDRAGKLVAAAGRYLDGGKPKTRDAGPKKRGAFATFGGWVADTVLLVEGPADALSLAACGYPAVAMMGCDLSDAAAWNCAMRRVAVATDADEAGDNAARKVMAALSARGAQVMRLRPPDERDWNDMLQTLGVDGLRAELDTALAAFREPEPEPVPEWTPEEQAVWDETRRQMAAVLCDRDLITWVRETYGCVLTLDGAGKLRAIGADKVPPLIREEIRGRTRMLTAHLRRTKEGADD